MASRPSKRLFVVVSVCLLLQQFSPAYAAHISRDKHSKKSHNKKQNHQGNSFLINRYFVSAKISYDTVHGPVFLVRFYTEFAFSIAEILQNYRCFH